MHSAGRYSDASMTNQKRDESFSQSCQAVREFLKNSVRKCLPKSSNVVSKKENCQQTNVVHVMSEECRKF